MLNNQRVFHCQARLSGLPVLGTVQKELQRFYGCSPALLESNSMCRSSSSWRIRRLGLAAMLDPGRQALNLGIPNLCVVYNPKLRKSNGWFRGTPISGNLHMSLVSWFFHAPTWRPCHLWGFGAGCFPTLHSTLAIFRVQLLLWGMAIVPSGIIIADKCCCTPTNITEGTVCFWVSCTIFRWAIPHDAMSSSFFWWMHGKHIYMYINIKIHSKHV